MSGWFSLATVGSRLFAISDDDFSRLVIAQQFAEVPKVDPSGTSWLPLPFWLYGSAFALFGNELAVARAVALVTGLFAVAGLYFAARSVGLSRAAAILAAFIGMTFPHAANYRAATVPDYPTAVLALLAATSLVSPKPRVRAAGALAAMAATLCRYETWPVALVVALFAATDWLKERHQRWLLAAAMTAPAGVLAWLLHGLVRHHDASFFVKRVTAYKRALGGNDASFVTRLFAEPLSLVREEPELIVTTVTLGLLVLLFAGRRAFATHTWKRPALALLSLLALLVIGELRDGTPTHHGERVLLSIWLACGLLIAAFTSTLASYVGPRAEVGGSVLRHRFAPVAIVLSLGLLVAITAKYVRPWAVTVEPFVDRNRELELGVALRTWVPASEPVALYTEDYGYFAIAAARGRPSATHALMKRDPRHSEPDPMSTPERLRSRLEALGARYFVVPATQRPTAEAVATRLESVAGFELFRRN